MKITPLEIRQKTFEKKLRGYDKDDVSAFLLSLSNEWERVLDDNKELKIKLEHAQKEVQKLREVENSLFKTLKTAEDTGANLIDQANKAAELHLRETQMNAEALINESKGKAKSIIERAEQEAKELIGEMQEATQDLERNYRAIENHRDNLITELRNLASDLLEKVEKSSKQVPDFKVSDHLNKVKGLVRDSERKIEEEELSQPVETEKIPRVMPGDEKNQKDLETYIQSKSGPEVKPASERTVEEKKEVKKGTKDEPAKGGSFFDQLGD